MYETPVTQVLVVNNEDGIGGSNHSVSCGNVYIYGGAGIGAGEGAALGELIIQGGTVLAHGGDDSNAICTHNDSGTNNLTIGKTMRLRIGDNILSYTERAFDRLKTYQHIQIEDCPHSGNPCDRCMRGR